MSHLPYYAQDIEPNTNEAITRLETAANTYAIIVLGEALTFDTSLPAHERINHIAEFLEDMM